MGVFFVCFRFVCLLNFESGNNRFDLKNFPLRTHLGIKLDFRYLSPRTGFFVGVGGAF